MAAAAASEEAAREKLQMRVQMADMFAAAESTRLAAEAASRRAAAAEQRAQLAEQAAAAALTEAGRAQEARRTSESAASAALEAGEQERRALVNRLAAAERELREQAEASAATLRTQDWPGAQQQQPQQQAAEAASAAAAEQAPDASAARQRERVDALEADMARAHVATASKLEVCHLAGEYQLWWWSSSRVGLGGSSSITLKTKIMPRIRSSPECNYGGWACATVCSVGSLVG